MSAKIWAEANIKQFGKLSKKIIYNYDRMVKKIAKMLHDRARRRTGNFVSNYNYNFDRPDTRVYNRKRLSRRADNDRIAAGKLERFRSREIKGRTVHIYNGTPYSGALDRKFGYTESIEAEFERFIERNLRNL